MITSRKHYFEHDYEQDDPACKHDNNQGNSNRKLIMSRITLLENMITSRKHYLEHDYEQGHFTLEMVMSKVTLPGTRL